MSIKPTTVPTKRLAQSIKSDATSFKLNNILGWDGSDLVAGDFGTVAYGCFRNSTNTLMELFEWDPSTIASASITLNKRGLQYDGNITTQVTANKRAWVKGDTYVELGSHVPQLLQIFNAASAGFNVETPSGTVDGSNTTFTVLNTPKALIIDGMMRFENFGYTLVGLTITVDPLAPPASFIRSFY